VCVLVLVFLRGSLSDADPGTYEVTLDGLGLPGRILAWILTTSVLSFIGVGSALGLHPNWNKYGVVALLKAQICLFVYVSELSDTSCSVGDSTHEPLGSSKWLRCIFCEKFLQAYEM